MFHLIFDPRWHQVYRGPYPTLEAAVDGLIAESEKYIRDKSDYLKYMPEGLVEFVFHVVLDSMQYHHRLDKGKIIRRFEKEKSGSLVFTAHVVMGNEHTYMSGDNNFVLCQLIDQEKSEKFMETDKSVQDLKQYLTSLGGGSAILGGTGLHVVAGKKPRKKVNKS